jgi:hypothetical protein
VTESVKAILQLVALALAAATIWVWCVVPVRGVVPRPDPGVWALRIVLPGVAILIWISLRIRRRPDHFPDHLASINRAFQECNGLCFVPVLDVEDGACRLSMFFQNRYSNGCRCDLWIQPSIRTSPLVRRKLPSVHLTIVCGGGEFGVKRALYPISGEYQGRTAAFDIEGDTEYPEGCGELLHSGRAKPVMSPHDRFFGALAIGGLGIFVGLFVGAVEGLCLAIGLAALVLVARRGPIRLKLPCGVAENIDVCVQPITEILWAPDAPTGGFPVIPIVRPLDVLPADEQGPHEDA